MKTETTFASLSLLGILLRIAHIPGSSLLLILALGCLGLIYFPFSFYFFPANGLKNQKIGLSLGSGFFLSNLVLGILFSLMHWPGGIALIFLAFIPLAILLFVTLNRQKSNKDENLILYYKNLVMRIVVVLAVAVLVYLTMKLTGQIDGGLR
ncbi:hypothetical protein HUK80_16170 [Flavobacterium sp. MAH-1]|uniref:DUF3429 domain-containing protein n=1 Tax=Flavobacterium agri TaxID=2743471 RepID=A0A7Y9C8J9_9FLAO|nr:hypothetical protein [Flavobacterium agri]NUY82443.1 hypothetical protein [Flavobacterium agri]NYA72467.1 hypothetical protein [Flavobacterium agri]